MIITFIGHSSLPMTGDLSEKIRQAILERVAVEEDVSFYCGGYGEFDELCASVCRSLKAELPRSEVIYVTPYFTESRQKRIRYYLKEKLYDSAVYPPLERVPPRLAILKRNEWMIQEADLILAYVTSPCGGAATALAYARKIGKRILLLE